LGELTLKMEFYLRGRPFVVVDIIECTHSIPQYTTITNVQPMYAQRLRIPIIGPMSFFPKRWSNVGTV